jgi:hypothetical protein
MSTRPNPGLHHRARNRRSAVLAAVLQQLDAGGIGPVDRALDAQRSLRRWRMVVLIGQPVEHHRRRQDHRGRIGLRLSNDVGRGAVAGLEHRVLVADVQRGRDANFEIAQRQIESLVEGDAGFRRLFALLGISPLFVTMQELFDDPFSVVRAIAGGLGAAVDENALEALIRVSVPYSRTLEPVDALPPGLSEQLRQRAFSVQCAKPGGMPSVVRASD